MSFSIKEISAESLKNSYFFLPQSPKVGGIILITTPTCVKCKTILKDEEKLEEVLPVGLFVYEFKGEDEGIEVLTDMGLSSAPIILYTDFFTNKKRFRSISSLAELKTFAESLDKELGD